MLTPGRRIGRYEVLSLVGIGGMAAVYRVRHVELGSVHALKLLAVHRDRVRERLLQEGRAQASLIHPNVVRVTDVLTSEDAPVLVMEFVEGPTLLNLVDDFEHLSLGTAMDIAIGVTRGLAAAHEVGLVYRDLKLANVLLATDPDGRYVPKIADFGLVKVVAADSASVRLTRAGSAMGTPEFMAPEQMRDASRVDARADLYSLGCMFYALLTGRLPFRGTDLTLLHQRILAGDYVRPQTRVPGLPDALCELVEQLLLPDPKRRPASATEVLARLQRPETWVPAGAGVASAGELLALAHRADWTPIVGPDPTSLARNDAQRGRSAAAPIFALPLVAALLGAFVPVPPAPAAAPPPRPSLTAPAPEPPPDPKPAVVPEPPPEPVPAPAPVPLPPPAPVPVPTVAPPPRPIAPEPTPVPVARPSAASVAVTGEATRVWLTNAKGRRLDLPSRVAPGTYQIVALFPGVEPTVAGTLEMGEEPVQLRCIAFARRCTVSH
ncbi:MAG: serine/threonine protein kinase [Alphaproteobacteria bacterium]|nr:serine/threonine protein kinase [Alphaproteobacteria bacterium]MCB9696715.1 serine/threonine protein kinase [Alphaproteobacteria bacterium]